MSNPTAPTAIADDQRSGDITRQAAVVAALAATLGVNALANALPLNGQTTGQISGRYPLKITPPGYVFGIWGVIYTGLMGYAIYQALPAQRENPRLRRVGWLFVLSCAANIAWLLLWHYNRPRQTMGAMVGILLALATISARLGKPLQGPLGERLLARLPFSVYLGWISVATIVNASVALYDAGWDGMGIDPDTWTAGLIGVGATLGAGMGVLRGDAAFPLVLVWAFRGIAEKQADSDLLAPAAQSAAIVAGLSAAAALVSGR
ncbi:tryptophan-rich sensory protein [Oscillochloris sp. ZM17-4]|uniref:TspO/MBR family protein n=1 Tax=Oscillochloris sp. ZM17-4 TaxID=2866714 RepID=UPI001C736DAF|nr:TspO/MBR family protein [Oscillochloris sp. ZM17-4]MBX0326562.1 tryptophan-rich sensory protein [Oscillochloris sp. ZM17-4]